MASCDVCTQEMLTADQCAANQTIEFPDGQRLSTIPFGSERDIPLNDAERQHVRCGDCGVRPGGAHHPGCDMEECPRCHGQRISCNCFDEAAPGDDDAMAQPASHSPPEVESLLARVSEDDSNCIEVGRFRGEECEHLHVLNRQRAFELLFSLLESLEVTMSASIPSSDGARRYQVICLNRMELVYSNPSALGSTEEFLVQSLTDARHLCDAQALDLGALDRSAYARYLEERRTLLEEGASP